MTSHSSQYHDGPSVRDILQSYTMTEIQEASVGVTRILTPAKRKKRVLLELMESLDHDTWICIEENLMALRSPSERRKRQRTEVSRAEQSNISGPANSRVTLNSSFSMNGPGSASSRDIESLLSSDFMRTTDNAHILTCIASYIEHTGNDYLTFVACFVCAKNLRRGGMHFVPFEEIPHRYLLRPVKTHYAHKLYDGLLVNESSVPSDPERRTYICRDCYRYLKHAKLPPLSLANDMWLGDVPIVLDILSLPEKVLIARYFSAAYIVKLYPKSRKGR